MLPTQPTSQQPKIQTNQQPLKSSTISTTQPIEQPKQSCTSKLNKFKTSLIIEILTAGLYLTVAFGIFCVFQRTTHVSLHQQTYFSSEQVVYPSEIRGLFPPIQGSKTKLYGKWTVLFTNSLQIQNNNIFNNYTIQFKTNNNLRIKRLGCDGDYIMKWQLFQYNIHINYYNVNQIDKQMIIEPDVNDIKCIKNNSNFVQILLNASVWTIYDQNLYVLIEKWEGNRNIQSILLLQIVQ